MKMQLTQRRCNYDHMNIERIAAWMFVAGGGLFWIFAMLGGSTGRTFADLHVANYLNALIPLAITVVVFGIGMYYEVIASALLLVLAVLAIAWGLIIGWEVGIWVIMAAVLILPMLVAAALYISAARMQQVCEYADTSA